MNLVAAPSDFPGLLRLYERSWQLNGPAALATGVRLSRGWGLTTTREVSTGIARGASGQIALHGLTNVGGVLGTAASHGCVRLGNDAMRWLVVRIGRPGVPVTIKT